MLNKFNFQIASLIDGEAIGPISGLLVSPQSTVETDGHQIIIVSAPEAQPSLFPADDGINEAEEFTPFILDKTSALKLSTILPKPKENTQREMAVIDISTETDGTATLAVNDDERRSIIKSEKIFGNFPAFEKMVPSIQDARFEISFNTDLLVPVLQAFKSFTGCVTLRLFAADKGMRIDGECDGQVMTSVVMPTRQVEQV